MPRGSKRTSKRVTVRLRHNIEKAGAAKQRKQRKLAKKDPTWRSKLKKDPGIPNLFPYKEKILSQIEERRRLKDEEAQRAKAEARALRTSQADADAEEDADTDAMSGASLVDDDGFDSNEDGQAAMDVDDTNPMAALLASAKARAQEFEASHGPSATQDDFDSDSDTNNDGGHTLAASKASSDPSSRAFTHLFPTVLSSADVILYVLDARDPPSTRSVPTERQIAGFEGGSKRLLLVLNKIDLVPPGVLKGWLSFLRRYHPTLPLRASSPAANAKVFDHKGLTQKATAENLLKALKAYGASQNFKRALTVGVVGFPNVGKSSVINALVGCLGGRRTTPAAAGAQAGVTTALKNIKLDGSVTMLDSPGVVFPPDSHEQTEENTKEDATARLVLLNALPPKAISDPIPAVSLLLQRLAADEAAWNGLTDFYGVPALMSDAKGDKTTDLLVHVARKRGRLGKGGIPNLEAAGMCVLSDWRDGRIAGWVEPPEIETASGGGKTNAKKIKGDQKEIVGEWAEEFRIEGLWESGRYAGVGNEGDEMEM